MYTAIRWSDGLFGRGEDSYPFWLLTVRVNIVLFAVCALAIVAWSLSGSRWRRVLETKVDACLVLVLTLLGGCLRFALARANLLDFGGIAYSRLLLGYRGYFGTAQFFSPLYQLTSRDIEHAILFNRVAGTLTIPLVYLLCRRLQPSVKLWAPTAAFMFAVYPLHILFSASDALAIFSAFLAASAYLLLAGAEGLGAGATTRVNARIATLSYLGGCSGLTLLTQVRYENVLFLIPPALLWLRRRRTLQWRHLRPGVLAATALLVIYGYEAAASGVSYTDPVQPWRNWELVKSYLILNPVMAIPVLLFGSLMIPLYTKWRFAVAVVLPWLVAFGLAVVASGDAHGTARIYANWLILILPLAAYGFALMLSAPQRLAKVVATALLICLGAQPLLVRDCLTAQYLEIAENDRFRSIVDALPPSVTTVIVPDNQLMWRQSHTTLEIEEKYSMIVAASGHTHQRRNLVGLTAFLEHPEQTDCAGGACVFFDGLPCTDDRMYLFTGEQCRELLRSRRAALLDETTVVSAPFVHCSVYSGALRRRFCEPATTVQRFALYRIEG